MPNPDDNGNGCIGGLLIGNIVVGPVSGLCGATIDTERGRLRLQRPIVASRWANGAAPTE